MGAPDSLRFPRARTGRRALTLAKSGVVETSTTPSHLPPKPMSMPASPSNWKYLKPATAPSRMLAMYWVLPWSSSLPFWVK